MRSTSIGWPLRFWFAVEVFFAISATITVALQPALTATNFAWTIKPEVMAALIGSFYLALGPVVLLALFAKRWEAVRVFVLPGMLFTFAQLVVTPFIGIVSLTAPRRSISGTRVISCRRLFFSAVISGNSGAPIPSPRSPSPSRRCRVGSGSRSWDSARCSRSKR